METLQNDIVINIILMNSNLSTLDIFLPPLLENLHRHCHCQHHHNHHEHLHNCNLQFYGQQDPTLMTVPVQ